MEPAGKSNGTNTTLTYWQADLTPGMEEILQEMVDDIRREAAQSKPHLLKACGLAEGLAQDHYATRLDQLEDLLANHDVVPQDLLDRFVQGRIDWPNGAADGVLPVPKRHAIIWGEIGLPEARAEHKVS